MNRALETCGVVKCMSTHTVGIPGQNGARAVERMHAEIMAEIPQVC